MHCTKEMEELHTVGKQRKNTFYTGGAAETALEISTKKRIKPFSTKLAIWEVYKKDIMMINVWSILCRISISVNPMRIQHGCCL